VKQTKGWDSNPDALQHVVLCVEDVVQANAIARELKQATASRLLLRSVHKQVMNKLGKDHGHEALTALQTRLETAVTEVC
jgi:hypothetical protein